MGSNTKDNVLEQKRDLDLFDKALSLSSSNIVNFFPEHEKSDGASLMVLKHISSAMFNNDAGMSLDFAKNMFEIAKSLVTNDFFNDDKYQSVFKKVHIEYAQLQVVDLKVAYKAKTYCEVLACIKSICFTLEVAGCGDDACKFVAKHPYDHSVLVDDGLFHYTDDLHESVKIAELYKHKSLPNIGLSEDALRSLLSSSLALELETVCPKKSTIASLKEEA